MTQHDRSIVVARSDTPVRNLATWRVFVSDPLTPLVLVAAAAGLAAYVHSGACLWLAAAVIAGHSLSGST
jgi:hypothetical protein